MRKEKSEAEKNQEAKECCENFEKNPVGSLFLSVIYIVSIAMFITRLAKPPALFITIEFSVNNSQF